MRRATWNPARTKHGTDNRQGRHDGDWDNLAIAADVRMIARRHADHDDEVTGPYGNRGQRVVFGVVIPAA